MGKIWMLAFAPIRKNKGQTASLLVLLVISGILLYLGLFLAFNTDKFFDDKMDQLDSPDIVANLQDTIFSEADVAYFRDNPNTEKVETAETVGFPAVQVRYAGSILHTNIIFLDEKKLGSMLSPRFVGEQLPSEPDSIYLPYVFYAGGGYHLGETFTVEYGTEDYTFTIAGFFEDVNFGLVNIGYTGMILADYDSFVSELDAPIRFTTILARMTERTYSDTLFNDYIFDKMRNADPEQFSNNYMYGSWYRNSKTGSTVTANIVAAIMILFSILIVVVTLIVVQYRIVNSIEDDMKNIGVLKAAGYTSGQIRSGILTQFLLAALSGSVLGILLSTVISPVISAVFASQNGLLWDMGFDVIVGFITLMLISASVLLTAIWATRRIKILHPIIALRGGITTHSYNKNYFPLDKAKSSLGMLLAFKNIKLKQSVSIALICASITFASVVFVVLYYNVGVNDKAFINLVSSEYCDAVVFISADSDPWQMLEDIRDMDSVRKAVFYSNYSAQVGRRFMQAYITEDFSDLEGEYIYEGRSPRHNNEIAIGGGMADQLGKEVGDSITVSFQGGTSEFLICGLGQSADNNGWTSQLTLEGARRLNASYRQNLINVYAKENVKPSGLCEDLRLVVGSQADSIIDMEKQGKAQLDTYIKLIFIITILILCVTALVIALVLYLTIKITILRRRRTLGIQKAVGFTTGQLMNQIALSFMPSVFVGVALGGIAGGLYANPLFSLLFRSIGFMRTNFIVQPMLVVMTGVVIWVFAYLIAMTVSWRIRKITAYSLISE